IPAFPSLISSLFEVAPAVAKEKSGRRSDRFSQNLIDEDGLTSATLSAVATTSAVTATTAAAAWRTWFARTRFINGERAPLERLAINFRNRLLRILVGAHRDKGEAARFAGEFVLHQHDFLHRTGLRKKLL